MSSPTKANSRTVATVVTIALAVLVVVMAAGLAYSIAGTASVVGRIQDERVRNTRNSCEAQNTRNTATKRQLRARVDRDETERLRLTIALIDALAPYRDCDDVVAIQTGASAP